MDRDIALAVKSLITEIKETFIGLAAATTPAEEPSENSKSLEPDSQKTEQEPEPKSEPEPEPETRTKK